jgi:hypothetical protein
LGEVKFRWKLRDGASLSDLLVSFFSLVTVTFNYHIDCVCLMAGHFLRVADQKPRLAQPRLGALPSVLFVKDPFRPLSNATGNVTQATIAHVFGEFRQAHAMMKKHAASVEQGQLCEYCGASNRGATTVCTACVVRLGVMNDLAPPPSVVDFQRDLCDHRQK